MTMTDPLRGPWVVVLASMDGEVLEAPESASYVDSTMVAVVRGVAPNTGSTWFLDDVPWTDQLYVLRYLTDVDDIADRWLQAQAIADALNATAGAEQGVEWAARAVMFDGGAKYMPGDEEYARMVVESMAMHLASLNEATRRAGGVERAELVRRETREWPDGSRWTGPWTTVSMNGVDSGSEG
jgi:hypothetical protein